MSTPSIPKQVADDRVDRQALIEAIESASYRSEVITGQTYVENYSFAFADAVLVLLYGPGSEDDAEEYSDLEYATRLDGTTMPAPRVLPNQHCWCGGEVGARVPGDCLGLGCLSDVTHNWTGAPG